MSCPYAADAPLDDGVLEEILRRLPPQPSSLPRASLVCKRWRRVVSDPGFLRRFRKHHFRNKPPPLLGFFEKRLAADRPPIFHPTMGQPDRVPPARFASPWSGGEYWDFFGCRHGLALLISKTRREAVVWDPVTSHQRRVAFPPGFSNEQGRFVQNGAVMCAAAASQDGHVHGDCRFTPFRLALVAFVLGGAGTHQSACLYDSQSGVWGDIVSVEATHWLCPSTPCVLIRDAFCWLLLGGAILEFDFQSQSLAVTEVLFHATDHYRHFAVVRTEHGGLGLAVLTESENLNKIIQLWERKSSCAGVVGWELQKTIQLDGLFSQGQAKDLQKAVMMQGYDEDTNAILLSTLFGDYMLQLESMQFINLSETRGENIFIRRTYYPYRNFYMLGSGDGESEMSMQRQLAH